MDIGTPQIANRRRSVLDDDEMEHVEQLLDDDGATATPAPSEPDVPAEVRR